MLKKISLVAVALLLAVTPAAAGGRHWHAYGTGPKGGHWSAGGGHWNGHGNYWHGGHYNYWHGGHNNYWHGNGNQYFWGGVAGGVIGGVIGGAIVNQNQYQPVCRQVPQTVWVPGYGYQIQPTVVCD